MMGETKKILKKLVCAGIIGLALAGAVREARATIMFDAPQTALAGETITIELVANEGEQVIGVSLALITDNGGAGGTKVGYAIPGFWNPCFVGIPDIIIDPPPGYRSGDLIMARAYCDPGEYATGVLYTYTYTVSSLAVEDEVINFTLEDFPGYGLFSYVWVLPHDDVIPADFDVTIVPEPCTIALLGLGSLALLRKRGRRKDVSIANA